MKFTVQSPGNIAQHGGEHVRLATHPRIGFLWSPDDVAHTVLHAAIGPKCSQYPSNTIGAFERGRSKKIPFGGFLSPGRVGDAGLQN